MGDEERSTRKNRERPAWAGSKEELEKIGRLVSELIAARRAILIHESDERKPHEDEPTRVELPGGQTIELPSQSGVEKINWTVERKSIEERMMTRATLVDGDDKLTSSVDRVFGELDGRTAKTLKIFGGTNYGDGIEVEFARTRSDPAVKINVTSPDQGWAKQAFVRLVEEVNKGVPRWAWIRSDPGRVITSVCAGIASDVALGLAIYPYLSEKSRTGILFPACANIWWIATIIFFAGLYNWFFPSFEIIPEGGQSSGSRRIGLVVGFVLALAGSLVINHLG